MEGIHAVIAAFMNVNVEFLKQLVYCFLSNNLLYNFSETNICLRLNECCYIIIITVVNYLLQEHTDRYW